jgi:GNAT superfamily N-acetyltransferase
MIAIEPRVPSVSEYLLLREAVGWDVPDAVSAERALAETQWAAVAVEAGEVVGMGRVVGDGVFYSFVVDVVVRPSHQRTGVGGQLMNALERRASATHTGRLQLVADRSVSPFYERRGYVDSGSSLMSKIAPDQHG